MLRIRRYEGNCVRTALAVWIVALGAIIPTLDRDLLATGTVIASGQSHACGRPHHNHTLCIQLGKQRWSTNSPVPLQVFPPTTGETLSIIHDIPVEFRRIVRTQSRAPPTTS